MKSTILCLAIALLCVACTKNIDLSVDLPHSPSSSTSLSDGFTKYTIPQGNNYCDGSAYVPVETLELSFLVRFDSSAIYQTRLAENQYDINKLYGFSDNGMDHHQFSARFGWRWSDGSLRLFAYVYNNGAWSAQEIGTINIGATVYCSIKVEGGEYIFTMDKKEVHMPRLSMTAKAKGYQLYPYFGGDETAPHEVRVWIKEE